VSPLSLLYKFEVFPKHWRDVYGKRIAYDFLVKEFVVAKDTEYIFGQRENHLGGDSFFRVTGFHNAGRKQALKPFMFQLSVLIITHNLFASSNANAVGAVAAFALDPAMADIRLLPKEVGAEDGSNLVAGNEAVTALTLINTITQVPCPTLSQDWKQALDIYKLS
jgi:hypothetical protein